MGIDLVSGAAGGAASVTVGTVLSGDTPTARSVEFGAITGAAGYGLFGGLAFDAAGITIESTGAGAYFAGQAALDANAAAGAYALCALGKSC